jgi:asparagine synthase (glutamine-hydrolysing)
MRQICHMHLTRMVQTLLDRKDRMSMAVGLEVRVPFCDHRLVQYVFNTPWSLKTYDGREKSILRGATRDVLPASVADRKKSGYPGSFDPDYLGAIQSQANELLTANHDVLEFFDRDKLKAATAADGATITNDQRNGIERALDMAEWFELRKPTLKLD